MEFVNSDINAMRFIKLSEIFLNEYIIKYDNIINSVNDNKKQMIANKWHLIFMSSDLSSSISYFDTIRNDLLRDYYSSTTKCYYQGKSSSVVSYLTRSNIFSLFILARSIILNSAYVNLYYEFNKYFNQKDDELFDDKFKEIIKNIFSNDELDRYNYIDIFNDNKKIYNFNKTSKSLITTYERQIIQEINSKGLNESSKPLNDTMVVKNLCFNIQKDFNNHFIKDNEIITLFEMSSKTYHRNESYLCFMNNLVNTHKLPSFSINTIFKTALISLFLVVNQIDNCMKIYGLENKKSEEFLKNFKSLESYI
ncbi:hypothetical protein GCL60_16675 [Silvanigrella paludirubra]|uniref:Uncharacterized protein n=1 Tax=Silvanigrella paludirubra TaxID=2499159 RepID=A0A6N6VNA0_9BACT|nr:hypothetical protein [Silvanigrella paludirubra]KAB8035864.1 hypothetical protein GCL60_16675 [Silvanigrella paludirubra]